MLQLFSSKSSEDKFSKCLKKLQLLRNPREGKRIRNQTYRRSSFSKLILPTMKEMEAINMVKLVIRTMNDNSLLLKGLNILYVLSLFYHREGKLFLLFQMNPQKFECLVHAGKKIDFFCTSNQWHFVPLCSECLPSHTQNHPKGTKVNIESFESVWEKHSSQKSKAIQLYQQKYGRILEQLNSQRQPNQEKELETYHAKMIEVVNIHFDQLKKSLEKKCKETKEYQQQLMQRLQKNLEADIDEMKSFDEIKDVNQWSDQVKRIYFKDSVQIYLEEIDELIKEHQQRIYERKDLSFLKITQIQQQMKTLLAKSITFQVVKEKEQIKTTTKKQTKKAPKIVNKPKICKICGDELKYLTEWKKHLVCPTCGGKERNYVPKPK